MASLEQIANVRGPAGADGPSAYELAVAAGFVGTEVEWLESLVGPAGESLPTRQTTTIPAAVGSGTVELAPAFTILSVDYSGAARLRLYRTAGGRDTDAPRPVTAPYPGRRGRIYEAVAEGAETIAEMAAPGAVPVGSTVYYQVDGDPVDITITWIRSEA